jgi:hypothetical protein
MSVRVVCPDRRIKIAGHSITEWKQSWQSSGKESLQLSVGKKNKVGSHQLAIISKKTTKKKLQIAVKKACTGP